MKRRRNRWGTLGPRYLAARCPVRVRFQEVDSLRVVWHGHYLTYCEEGREAFGKKFGFSYQAILDAGFIAPVVHIELDYFQPAHYDQVLDVETRLHVDPGARINFSYLITNERNDKVAVGRSVQVFTEIGGELLLTRPEFFVEFLERHQVDVESEWSAKER